MKGQKNRKVNIPDIISVLPLRDAVLYPELMIPLVVGRDRSVKLIEDSLKNDNIIGLVTQKDPKIEEPKAEDLYSIGTTALITKMIRMPDGTLRVIVQGLSRFKAESVLQTAPYYVAKVEILEEPDEKSLEIDALVMNAKKLFKKLSEMASYLSSDLASVIVNMETAGKLADLIASSLKISTEEKQEVLEAVNLKDRLEKVNVLLNKEINILEIGNKIQTQVKGEIDKTQREYYLREQLKAIQKELGEGDERGLEVEEFREKIEKAKMPADVKKVAEKELKRLSKMHPASAEYSVCRTYLEVLVELPWMVSTDDNLDVKQAAKVLDEDHYDLEKVKKRILEYLAVRQLKSDMKGPILCFVGPPGVGKTSLGRSIARALGRKFIRISLGGVRDEAEIRGHRRTYVGALPGRIIQSIKKVGSNNPVFMLDEVDKIGTDFRGDPSSALLEVLDPEQNFAFSDHYLEAQFDLSKVMFIATANLLDPIPPPLQDRMEVIEIPGYTDEDKLRIATNFLIPKQRDEHGLKLEQIQFQDQVISDIIRNYTREAGVRNLEREIATICRGVAKEIVEGTATKAEITPDDISKYLGPIRFFSEVAERTSVPGVATGLAWTAVGGDILFVEASKMKGKRTLVLTGHLGDVMKESAQAALSYLRSKSKEFNIPADFFEDYDIHVHVPAGAQPKDGPSAGVTLFVAMFSMLTGRPVRNDVAMTGEITLRGAVLPIGGIKEKVLAAKRAGISKVILPERNRKDLEDVPANVKENLEFLFIKRVDEIIDLAVCPDTMSAQEGQETNISPPEAVPTVEPTYPQLPPKQSIN
jgi:ATP-dependent Lon protease